VHQLAGFYLCARTDVRHFQRLGLVNADGVDDVAQFGQR
jgi:hypothetical protein